MNHLASGPTLIPPTQKPIKHPVTNLKTLKHPENPIAATPVTHRLKPTHTPMK